MSEKVHHCDLPTGPIPLPLADRPHRLRRVLSNKGLHLVLAAAAVVGVSWLREDNRDAAAQAQLADAARQLAEVQQQLDRTVDVAAQLSGVDPNIVRGKDLRPIEKLPGYGNFISLDQRALAEDTSVSVLIRPAEAAPGDPWNTWCSGNIVTINKQKVVETAATCFEADRSRVKADTPELAKTAFDVAGFSASDYAVVPSDPVSMPDPYPADKLPLGLVRNAAVMPGSNTALLGIDTSGPVLRSGQSPLFDTLPALTHAPSNELPSAGQEGILAPRLLSHENARTAVAATYLGAGYMQNTDPKQRFFSVGVHANPVDQDGCGLGALGMLADGTTMGPVYERINPGAVPEDTTKKLWMEGAFKVDLSRFEAVCSLDYPTSGQLNALLEAFGRTPGDQLIAPPR